MADSIWTEQMFSLCALISAKYSVIKRDKELGGNNDATSCKHNLADRTSHKG